MSTANDVTRPAARSPRRIVVKGTSGAGKSTFGPALARRLSLPYVELDSLYWDPNWQEANPDEFRARVRQAMDAAPGGWVIDGNYDSKLGQTVVGAADTIVWLDLPLPLKLVRACRRSLLRIGRKTALWNGNRETWRGVFLDPDSVLRWSIASHRRHRRDWPPRFAGDPRLVRLRSDRAVRRWLNEQTAGREP